MGITVSLGGIVALVVFLASTIGSIIYFWHTLKVAMSKVKKHDEYLTKDREAIEQLKRKSAVYETQIDGIKTDVAEIKENTNRILTMLIEKR